MSGWVEWHFVNPRCARVLGLCCSCGGCAWRRKAVTRGRPIFAGVLKPGELLLSEIDVATDWLGACLVSFFFVRNWSLPKETGQSSAVHVVDSVLRQRAG